MTAKTPSPHPLTLEQARRAWRFAQRLDGATPPQGVPGGWSRAIGGVDPYLALFARDATVTRAEIDAALLAGDIAVMPGVRGCIWLVPRADVPLALSVGLVQFAKRNTRDMAKLGITREELNTLGKGVREVLADGARTPKQLRDALPNSAIRSLGDVGKKIGVSSTLPMTLRYLEGDGQLRRFHVGGRIDTENYAWALADTNLLKWGAYPASDTDRANALASRFFTWAGPATTAGFAHWSALGKTACRAAVKRMVAAKTLIPATIAGTDDDGDAQYWLTAAQLEAASSAPEPAVYLLGDLDNYMSLRFRPGVLAAPRHHSIALMGIGGRKGTVGQSRWLNQRPLLVDGEWVGLWEWDLDAGEVIYAGFDPLSDAVHAQVVPSAAALEVFIRESLEGTARANALDNEKSQRARVAAIQAMK